MKKLLSFTCCILIFGTACGGGGSSLSSEDRKLVDALADVVAADKEFPGTADDAECIAEKTVSALGATYIQENNFLDGTAFDDWDPVEAGLPRENFKKLFKGIIGCVESEFQSVLGDDAELAGLSEESIKCLANKFMDDAFLDVIYDAGSLGEDPPDEMIFRMFEDCPSFLVDSLIEGLWLDRESAECFADKISYESFIFSIQASMLPEDEIPEGATEVIAEFFAAAVECDIDLANLG